MMNFAKKRFSQLLLATAMFAGAGTGALPAASYILPVTAIDASAELEAEEFRDQYPGIALDGGYLADFGYFIRYNHENLYYFFGPVDQLDEAQAELSQLENILLDAVERRPALSTATIDIIQFDRNGLRNLGDGTGSEEDGDRPFGGSTDGDKRGGDGSLNRVAGLGGSNRDESGPGGDRDGGEGTGPNEEGSGDREGTGNEEGGMGELVRQVGGEQQGQSDGSGQMSSTGNQQSNASNRQQSNRDMQDNRGRQQGSQNSNNPPSPNSPSSPNQRSGSGSPSNPSPSQQGGGGGGPPPPPLWEILRRIFGG